MIVDINYNPLPAAVPFHASSSLDKLLEGGKGSGKTKAMWMEGFMLSMEYPGNVGLLSRETFDELQEVIIDPMLAEIPEDLIANYEKQHHKLLFTNGSIVYYRPSDEARKRKGLTLGWFGIDELDALDIEMYLQLVGQCRLPGVRWEHMATTNPTTREHWIYERWVLEQLKGYEVFRFRTRDNKYLPPGFVETLTIGMPDSWIARYLDGEWGSISTGDRVHPYFSEKIHGNWTLVFNPAIPLMRLWDFGLNGHACIFAQFREPAGLDFLGEVFKKKHSSRQFAQIVKRYQDEHFPEAACDDVGDIAGKHEEATSGTSPIAEIEDELHCHIRTNTVPLKASLDLVNVKLGQIISGIPALRYDKKCRLLVEGMAGGYVWKKARDGSVIRDVPAQDQVFEHLTDPARYGIWDKLQFTRTERKVRAKVPELVPVWDETSW